MKVLSLSSFAFFTYLPRWRKVKPFVYSAVAIAVTGAALLYLSGSLESRRFDRMVADTNRDYRLIPFDMVDALYYCQVKTESKFGDRLAMFYVDEHSTRMDSQSNTYKIFMVAHVGNLDDYEEEAVHCFVDPRERVLTHYRTINLRKASLVSRAVRFFQ